MKTTNTDKLTAEEIKSKIRGIIDSSEARSSISSRSEKGHNRSMTDRLANLFFEILASMDDYPAGFEAGYNKATYSQSQEVKQDKLDAEEDLSWKDMTKEEIDKEAIPHYKDKFPLEKEQEAIVSDKPLSEITDEDAIEIATIEGLGNAKILRDKYKIRLIDDTYELVLIFDGRILLYRGENPYGLQTTLKIYQFLQSKGYKLPVFFSPPQSIEPVKDGFEKWLEERIANAKESYSDNELHFYSHVLDTYCLLSPNKEGDKKGGRTK